MWILFAKYLMAAIFCSKGWHDSFGIMVKSGMLCYVNLLDWYLCMFCALPSERFYLNLECL